MVSYDDGNRTGKPEAISSLILSKAGGIVAGRVRTKGAVEAARGISAQVFFLMLNIAIESYDVSRRKCSSPADPQVEDLGTSSMSCFNSFAHKI